MKDYKTLPLMALILLSTCLLSSAAPEQTSNSVLIQDFSFQPNILTIPVGVSVTWTNDDTVQHEVVDENGAFDSGIMMPNASFSYTFSQAGNYSYSDKIYPYMFGQIQVTQGQTNLTVMSANSGPDPAMAPSSHSESSMFSQFYHMQNGPEPHLASSKLSYKESWVSVCLFQCSLVRYIVFQNIFHA
jgi:plastocyanin